MMAPGNQAGESHRMSNEALNWGKWGDDDQRSYLVDLLNFEKCLGTPITPRAIC